MINQLFTGTVLLAILTYVGYQLRTVPTLIWEQIRKRVVYSAYIEETSELFIYFEVWLSEFHEQCFKNVKASMSNDNKKEPSNNTEIDEKLVLSHYTDMFILKYNGKRLLITKGREKFENASDLRNAFYNNFKIEGWFAKNQINKLLNEVIEYNKSIRKVKQIIYTNNNWGDWMYFGEVYGKTINNIVIDNKQTIIDDIKDFISKENWYFKRGLTYKRGFLFYGSPGNGKTSLCLALAKYFNRHIQFLNLNDLEKDSSLFVAFNNIKNNSILVVEDVDAIFGTREGKSKISFSALLNCMDGAFSKYGVITIMTTNHIDKIDEALIREGRIDVKINIDNPKKEMVESYLSLFYETTVELQGYDFDFSMSKIQEICLQNKNNLNNAILSLLPDRAKRGEKTINTANHAQI